MPDSDDGRHHHVWYTGVPSIACSPVTKTRGNDYHLGDPWHTLEFPLSADFNLDAIPQCN